MTEYEVKFDGKIIAVLHSRRMAKKFLRMMRKKYSIKKVQNDG